MILRVAILTILSFGYACGACPAGWVQHGPSCYKFQTSLESWPSARRMCIWHDSDLMAIETKAEQDWFVSVAKTYNHTGDDEGFWLGATDWAVEGHWVWESAHNEPLTFAVWGKDQPNNRQNREHCLAAVHYFDYIWSDEYCDDLQIQYVCEKNATINVVVG